MKKAIKEAPGYFISNNGEFSNSIGVTMKPDKLKNGYLRIQVKSHGQKVRLRIHRLVAQYFVPNPINKPQVNHDDGNKENNHFTNLKWATNQENMIHAFKLGLTNHTNHHENGKMYGAVPFKPVTQLTITGEYINRFSTVKEAKRLTGIQISGALSGRYKTAGGFKWVYEK